MKKSAVQAELGTVQANEIREAFCEERVFGKSQSFEDYKGCITQFRKQRMQ